LSVVRQKQRYVGTAALTCHEQGQIGCNTGASARAPVRIDSADGRRHGCESNTLRDELSELDILRRLLKHSTALDSCLGRVIALDQPALPVSRGHLYPILLPAGNDDETDHWDSMTLAGLFAVAASALVGATSRSHGIDLRPAFSHVRRRNVFALRQVRDALDPTTKNAGGGNYSFSMCLRQRSHLQGARAGIPGQPARCGSSTAYHRAELRRTAVN